jgi:DNA-binding transcriptional LysR family regulator
MELPGSPGRQWTVAVCRAAGFEPDVVYESTDMVVHAELVGHGHAVAFLPDLMWVGRSPLVRLRHLSPAHRRAVVTTCRSGARTHPTITAVRDALRHAALSQE